MRVKDKNLSQFKYFEILQLEYIVAELRRKIYAEISNKTYWKKVMNYKKGIIEDISSRNSLPNIFSDEEYKREMYKVIYNEMGMPNFRYKDEEQRELLELQDIKNYFREDSEVKIFITPNIIKIGKIKNVNLGAELIEVELNENEIKIVSFKDTARIL